MLYIIFQIQIISGTTYSPTKMQVSAMNDFFSPNGSKNNASPTYRHIDPQELPEKFMKCYAHHRQSFYQQMDPHMAGITSLGSFPMELLENVKDTL
ncbi:hypothetical protein OCU04_006630 [Sclerotinia nivalis]|uniref:Uncharacterized protein n=1 Tax=Sclerotinia nivalis TaxID=352851 RepID=A0A9X0AL29_9HELO|nr:hypothetical protein OCU04_006630 [Sclerotinia nivalis]